MCWCVVGQTTNVAEDGVTTSGYGTEYAWQVRAVGYIITPTANHTACSILGLNTEREPMSMMNR